MKRKKLILGVLMLVTALIIMQLPVSEADAAASASDFKIEGGTLVKYRGTEKNVSVPNTVTTIGRSAFEDNTNIELVVLPNSVVEIEPYAFWGCDNLDTVVLGKKITAVGDYAFAGCKGLEQMTIPDSVTSIGIQAFGDCVNLRDISIPVPTADIHETAFDGCARLTIHCDPGSAADEYAKAFYERQKEMPEYEDVPNYDPSKPVTPDEPNTADPTPSPAPVPDAPETPEQPGEVLGSTHVVGNSAVVFVDNRDLQVYGSEPQKGETTIPSDGMIADIGSGSIPKFAIIDGRIVADQAYYRSGKLDSVTLPEGIREIGQFSFARSSLSAVSMPEGTETVGYGAFYHCDFLEQVSLPSTIMCVEPKAFDHTLWKDRFLQGEGGTGDFLAEGGVLVAYRGNASEVEIPEGIRVIAAEAFQNHTEIESISLPSSLLVIGEGAFEGCSSLQKIDFGSSVEEIKDRAFKGSAMAEITVPESVKKLGLQAFGNSLITYAGREAEYTHETSAARLSNSAYRVYGRTSEQEPGVTVLGIEGGFSDLEGADRGYSLSVTWPEDISEMRTAFLRSFQTDIPDNMTVFDLTLTDDSNIPLTKLGNQTLTVILPLPDVLKGQAVRLFTLDRNGQLEMLPAEHVSAEGVESIRFQTNHLSLFGIYGLGEANEELMEVSVDFDGQKSAPGAAAFTFSWMKIRLFAAGICMAAGIWLIFSGMRTRQYTMK